MVEDDRGGLSYGLTRQAYAASQSPHTCCRLPWKKSGLLPKASGARLIGSGKE